MQGPTRDRALVLERRGSVWIGAAATLAALGSLTAQLLFERSLGVHGFAEWAFLNAVLGIAVPIACLGSNHVLLSEYYGGRLEVRDEVVDLLRYFAALSFVSLVALLIAYRLAAPEPESGISLILLAVLFTAQLPVTLVFPIFQARGQVGWVAGWPLAQVGVRVAIALLALAAGWVFATVVALWTALSCGLAVIAVLQALPALRVRFARRNTESGRRVHEVRRAGFGFGLSDLFGALDLKLMVPLASALLTPVATAAAGLAVVVLAAAQFFPNVLVLRVLLPAVHSQRADVRSEVVGLVRRLVAWGALPLILVATAWYWVGYDAIGHLVRGDYASQATALALVGLCMVPLCISELAAAPHMARPYAWRLLRWRIEAVCLFAGVSLALHPALGLSALLLGFACGRTWLCIRLLVAMPAAAAQHARE